MTARYNGTDCIIVLSKDEAERYAGLVDNEIKQEIVELVQSALDCVEVWVEE